MFTGSQVVWYISRKFLSTRCKTPDTSQEKTGVTEQHLVPHCHRHHVFLAKSGLASRCGTERQPTGSRSIWGCIFMLGVWLLSTTRAKQPIVGVPDIQTNPSHLVVLVLFILVLHQSESRAASPELALSPWKGLGTFCWTWHLGLRSSCLYFENHLGRNQ